MPNLSLAANPFTAFAGNSFTGQVASGSFSGFLLATAFTATIDWGDLTVPSVGTVVPAIGGTSGTLVVNGTHTYAAAGTYTTVVTVTETVTGFSTSSSNLATVVAAPTVTVPGITAGAGVSFSGQVASGAYSGQGTLSASIDWGDLSTSVGSITLTGPTSYTVSGTHTYAATGSFALSVMVLDTIAIGDSASTTGNGTATVVAPLTVTASNISATATVPFSGTVATGTFTGITGPFTATINWGDSNITLGTVVTSGATFTVSGSHTYATAGSFPLLVTVSDTNGHSASSSAIATVNLPTLSVTVLSINATEGLTFSGSVATGTFSAGITLPLSATINWGDGHITSGTIVTSGSTFTVSGSHTYTEEGSYSLMVTVSDTNGHSVSGSNTATVGDAALTLTLLVVSGAGAHLGILNQARFSDANTLSTVADFTATINWGDSTTSTAIVLSLGSGNYLVNTTIHTYAIAGIYTVTLTILDDGGSSVSGSQSITVY